MHSKKAIVAFLVLFTCTVQIRAHPIEQSAGIDPESFNTKWTAIKTWLNSTKLATTNSIISPRIKLLCTNKLIDLIVVMCKQYLTHEMQLDSILGTIDDPNVSGDEIPRIRHGHHHAWNRTSLAATNKRLRSLLRKTLPAIIVQTCCSESCNVTSLINYCPTEPRPTSLYVVSKNVIIGTISTYTPPRHQYRHQHQNMNGDNRADPLNRMGHGYEIWRVESPENPSRNLDSGTTSRPTFNFDSDEFEFNESSNGRNTRENQVDHQSTTIATTTTTTRRHSLIDSYPPNQTPEPYTFGLRSSDILYAP